MSCKDQHITLIADAAYRHTNGEVEKTLAHWAVEPYGADSSEIQTEQKVSFAVFRVHKIQSQDHNTGSSPVIF